MPERVINKRSWHNEPVRLMKLKVKEKPIGLKQKFLEEDDEWFRSLNIELKNVSNKPIVFINFTLIFARPEKYGTPIPLEGAPYASDLRYGRDPLTPKATVPPDELNPIMPGKTINLIVTSDIGDRAVASFKKLNYSAGVKELWLVLGRVVFDDDTMWNAGNLFRRDPNSPNGYSLISQLSVGTLNHGAHTKAPQSDCVATLDSLIACQANRPDIVDDPNCKVEESVVFNEYGGFTEPVTVTKTCTIREGPHQGEGCLLRPTSFSFSCFDDGGDGGCEIGLCNDDFHWDSSQCSCVPDHSPLPHRTFPDFELRLDKRHHVPGAVEQFADARQHQSERDEGHINHAQVGRHR